MPSAIAESPPRPRVLSESTNSSFDGPRKSHDKTLTGVFTYTNGTDVETGLAEHRLDQIRGLRNGSHSSLTNGVSAGSLKSRERAHSKAGSSHSIGSNRGMEGHKRELGSSDGLSRLSNVENLSDELPNGVNSNGVRPTESRSKRTSQEHDSTHMAAPSTRPETEWADGSLLSPNSNRHVQPLNRFSSPPNMSAGASQQDKQKSSAEMPRLTQRHTLSIPRPSQAPTRGSRDFSFQAGPSEEALYSTGRFSPTRDHAEGPVTRARRASLGLVRRTTRSMQSDPMLEDIPQDEDAARWTELIRQKRASRRKRREEEDDDRVIVGKKVEEGHVNWVTAYNMLTGIRFTVSRTNAKIDRDLTDADFDARHKFSFDVTGNELTPSAKYDFKFKDYAPWVFRHLRAIFGLDPADYLMSLTSKYILSELGSPGKSGSFFYFSRDYKYIIKTIHHAEHKLLRRILRDYYKHVVDNPNTLISQIYGLHRVKIPYGRKIHFMVMNNLFPPHRDIHQTFDLKGSTVGRDFKEEELENNPRATLKDLNWLRRDYHLEFDARVKQGFIDQITRDVHLLQRLHIMDYSLLVGIHDLAKGNDENLRQTTLRVFQPGGEKQDDDFGVLTRTPSRLENARKARQLRLTLKKERPMPMNLSQANMPEEMASGDERHDRMFYRDDGGIRASHEDGSAGEMIYYLGVIDCLTHYGFVKRIEHFYKGLKDNRTQISPVPPQQYGDRFINFITGITMTREEAERRQTGETNRSELGTVNDRSRQNSNLKPLPSLGIPGQSQQIATTDGGRSPPGSPLAVEKTMKKAQKQVNRETDGGKEGRRRSEEEKPSRTLLTSPGDGTLLPVVSEENMSARSSRGNSLTPQRRRNSQKDSGLGREERLPPLARESSGIRMVSASTKRDSNEKEREQSQEPEDLPDGDLNEKVDVKIFSLPPRLNSDMIPEISPISEKANFMDSRDPEKS